MNNQRQTPIHGEAHEDDGLTAWTSSGVRRVNIALSIITANYNSASLLTTTLSALKPFAENPSIELIVVDGGSTDESKYVINEYRRHIAQFVCENDKGVYDAMNKGIKLCRGDWVWFVNAGDIPAIKPDEALETIKHSQQVAANYIYSDLLVGQNLLRQQVNLRFLAYNTINHQNTVYSRGLLSGGFDSSYRYCADYSHLLNVYGRLRPLKSVHPICLYDYSGISSLPSRSRRIAIWNERLRAQVESPLNIAVKALFISVSILAILGKLVHPGIGRTRLRQSS
jgi:glycosyltransferase involved in cell wall biosynthesis